MTDRDLLPRYVAADENPRAGVIHIGRDGLWRANGQSGPLGTFSSAEEAEEAIRTAPARPRERRPAREPPPKELRFTSLTAYDRGYAVYFKQKRVGAVICTAGNNYAAWSKAEKLGEYLTTYEAEKAVLDRARKDAATRKVPKNSPPPAPSDGGNDDPRADEPRAALNDEHKDFEQDDK
jgi:hypothetical protein